jgi:5-methylcytosine-specific restriction endonuclease McrA
MPIRKLRAAHTFSHEYQVFRSTVLLRAGYQCERCGARGNRLFADHIVEVADGGANDPSNGQCLCGACHNTKTNNEKIKRASRVYGQSI